MEERVSSPDSFFVTDVLSKAEVYVCKGEQLSDEGEKRLFDVNGTKLFFMTHQVTSIRQLHYLFDNRSGDVYSIMKQGLLPGRGRGTLLVRSGTKEDGKILLEVKTNGLRSMSEILKNGQRVATIERSLVGAKKLLTGLHSYTLKVEAGFDVPLAIIITVCIDENYTEGYA